MLSVLEVIVYVAIAEYQASHLIVCSRVLVHQVVTEASVLPQAESLKVLSDADSEQLTDICAKKVR